ncbi:hypothetical protein [Mycoplasma sp. OR1901]|uniref:hypothetical protein n=1 Tax=Mycoplasma sp. OR1901 TaxID=2742195 RepID=UPI001581ADB8|nr:hypothetical protein [Mycoplasma sp. OR1901]QKT05461.1 hypothetical protein HTZ87_01955 [Mycoplasma sp. OR1901]
MNKKLKKILIASSMMSVLPITVIACSSASNIQKPQSKESVFTNIVVESTFKNASITNYDELTNEQVNNQENYILSAPSNYKIQFLSANKVEQGISINFKLSYKNLISKEMKTIIQKTSFLNNTPIISVKKDVPNFDELSSQVVFTYKNMGDLSNNASKLDLTKISNNTIEGYVINPISAYNFEKEIIVQYTISNDSYSSQPFEFIIKKNIESTDNGEKENTDTEGSTDQEVTPENNDEKLKTEFNSAYTKTTVTFDSEDFSDFNSLTNEQINKPENYTFAGSDLKYKFISAKKIDNNKILVDYKIVKDTVESSTTYQTTTSNNFNNVNFSYLNKKVKVKYKDSQNIHFDQVVTTGNNEIANENIEFVPGDTGATFEYIDAVKDDSKNRIKVTYKLKYNNEYSQVFVNFIEKHEFKLTDQELNEITNGVYVDFNNPGNYNWNKVKEKIDSESEKASFATKEIAISYTNPYYIPEYVSISHDENQITVNLTIDNFGNKHPFSKTISKDIFIDTPAEPEESRVIKHTVTTYSTSLRFDDLFNKQRTITIKEDDNSAKEQGIKPGVYKIKFLEGQEKTIYHKDENSSNIQNGKTRTIYAELTGFYSENAFKKLRYELHLNFMNVQVPDNQRKWLSSHLSEFTFDQENSNEPGINKIISTPRDNRWDTWNKHNKDQTNDKNYITIKINGDQPKVFYRVDISYWSGASRLDSKLILPEKSYIQYSNDGKKWINAKYQNKVDFKDFGSYRLYSGQANSDRTAQKYFETYNVNMNDTNAYFRPEINFVPFEAKYIRFAWEPQRNQLESLNGRIENSLVGFRKLDFQYKDNDANSYDVEPTFTYENDSKRGLLDKINEVIAYAEGLSSEGNEEKINQIRTKVQEARTLFYGTYNESSFNDKISELNNLIAVENN